MATCYPKYISGLTSRMPLAPVLSASQMLLFCNNKELADIVRMEQAPVERLEDWTNHHYPAGRRKGMWVR